MDGSGVPSEELKILYQDERLAAFHKPPGWHVHPHEDRRHRVPRDRVLLYRGRDLLGRHLYPVHRLDAGTCGVVLFALSSEAARGLALLFQERRVEKTYLAVVRGWLEGAGAFEQPLPLDSTGTEAPARTTYEALGRIETPSPPGSRHPTARFSLLRVRPETGRFHQIRRHLARASHPLIGDAEHGDSRQNRIFRGAYGVAGLCLKAQSLRLTPPWSAAPLELNASPCERWRRLAGLFQPGAGA